MTEARRRLGAQGEQATCEWYEKQGYTVVERNWRVRAGEIDIVAARSGELVFCEVKTRSSDRFGAPAEAVTLVKQRKLRQLALTYLAQHPAPGHREIRFDVASVTAGTVEVLHNAF